MVSVSAAWMFVPPLAVMLPTKPRASSRSASVLRSRRKERVVLAKVRMRKRSSGFR